MNRRIWLPAILTIVMGLAAGCGGGETEDELGAPQVTGVWLMEAQAVFPAFVGAFWVWSDHTVAVDQSVDSGQTFCTWKGKWTYPEGEERSNGDLLIAQIIDANGGCGKEGGDEILMTVRMLADASPIKEMKYRMGDIDLDGNDVPDTRFYLCSKDDTKTTKQCDPGLGGIYGESDFPAERSNPGKPALF